MSDYTKCPDCGSVILKRYSGGVRYECWTERIDPLADSSTWFNRSSACVIIDQLRADLERVTKERDEARAAHSRVDCEFDGVKADLIKCHASNDANWDAWAKENRRDRVDLIDQIHKAREQRDRAMELVLSDVLDGDEYVKYYELQQEIAKEKEQSK